MRNRGRHRRLSGAGGLGPDAAHTILTVTDNGGFAVINCAADVGAVAGQVVVSGNSEPAYNTTHDVDVALGSSIVTFTAYTADGVGGTWSPA